MKNHTYSKFKDSDLILRDELAIDRTLLANERTFLAYLRSGVALVIAGISIVHFSNKDWFIITGIACIPTGVISGIVGLIRYKKMDRSIAFLRNKGRTTDIAPGSEDDEA